MAKARRTEHPSVVRWFVRAAAALGILLLLITFTPIDYWWATALAGPWDDPKGDVLVVLTGSLLDDRTIGMNSYWRAVYAAHAFLDDRFQEMIISGGAQDQLVANAIPMRDFVVAQGVPAPAVQLETASVSTRDSALEVAKMLEGKRDNDFTIWLRAQGCDAEADAVGRLSPYSTDLYGLGRRIAEVLQ